LPLVGSWTHVTLTTDGVNAAGVKLYYNGVLQTKTSSTDTLTATTKNSSNLDFGIDSFNGASQYLAGTMDNIKMFNYTRTQKQIVQDMNAGHPAVGSPVGTAYVYYKFDEGQGTVANNSGNGGSSVNGAIANGTWTNSGKLIRLLLLEPAQR